MPEMKRSTLVQDEEAIAAVLDLRAFYERKPFGCNISLNTGCAVHGPECRYAKRVRMLHGLAKTVKVAVMPEDF